MRDPVHGAVPALAVCGAVLLALAGACGEKSPGAAGQAIPKDPIALAVEALDGGAPRSALSILGEPKADEAEPLRVLLYVMALIETNQWGRVESIVGRFAPKLAEADVRAVRCMLAAARKDVAGDRLCRERGAEPESPTLQDGAARAWARVAENELRLDEAELRWRQLMDRRKTIANRKAYVSYLERQGFVAEAVKEVEAWKVAAPEDASLNTKLMQLLERKVRGDLLEKRADEAVASASRILEIDPKRAEIRYFLADALEQKGEAKRASEEREKARAAGAVPPPAPNTFPGMDGARPGPGAPGHQHHGHDHQGHDHDHDH